MTGSCGSLRHTVIVVHENESGLLVLVCRVCGRRVLSAPEDQGSFMWELMKDLNTGDGTTGRE